MKLLAATILCVALAGCYLIDVDGPMMGIAPAIRLEIPIVNLPASLRQANWLGNLREGSCVHATLVSLFRWQGRTHTADWWRKHHGNGEWPEHLNRQLDAAGIRYAYTAEANDVAFLEWSIRTCRGCGVTVLGGRHMVALVHLDDRLAGILDNNAVNKILWVPRETFLAEWANSNSWAVTPIYTPAPPLPQGS